MYVVIKNLWHFVDSRKPRKQEPEPNPQTRSLGETQDSDEDNAATVRVDDRLAHLVIS